MSPYVVLGCGLLGGLLVGIVAWAVLLSIPSRP